MPPAASSRQADLAPERWFQTDAGARLLAWERRLLIPQLTTLYGRNGLYLRPCAAAPAELSGNMLQSVLRLQREHGGFAGDLRCADDCLPIATESMALVYAQHVFETSTAGSLLAGEIARVLAPEGTCLVTALSSASLWRLRWRRAGLGVAPVSRVLGWLMDAGLEAVAHRGAGPVLPWRLRDESSDAPVSSSLSALRPAQLLVLRKRRPGMTPLRARRSLQFAAHPGA